jgi:site-specific DNA-cytosine methylase
MLASVYKWALGVYPNEIKVNPVTGTWNPPRMKSTGQSFSMEELGAIWRACETLEANAPAMCRNGQAFKPGQRVDAPDDQVISCREAGRLTGFDSDVFCNAVKDGRLRGERGRVVTKTRGHIPAF